MKNECTLYSSVYTECTNSAGCKFFYNMQTDDKICRSIVSFLLFLRFYYNFKLNFFFFSRRNYTSEHLNLMQKNLQQFSLTLWIFFTPKMFALVEFLCSTRERKHFLCWYEKLISISSSIHCIYSIVHWPCVLFGKENFSQKFTIPF